MQTAVQAFLPFLLVAICLGSCRAEDRLFELPKDGSWVRYDLEMVGPDGTNRPSTVTLSIVGSVVENETRCRWVQVKWVVPKGWHPRYPDGGTILSKMLISEQDLRENAEPFQRAVRTWQRKPGEDHAEQTKVAATTGPNLMLWAPGMLRTLDETSDEKTVEYQRGQLKSARAWTGVRIFENMIAKSQFKSTYKVWMHPDLPVGFAEAEIVDDITYANGQAPKRQSQVYRLQDAGTDAKSELPDNN
jgi:hypothetical protein